MKTMHPFGIPTLTLLVFTFCSFNFSFGQPFQEDTFRDYVQLKGYSFYYHYQFDKKEGDVAPILEDYVAGMDRLLQIPAGHKWNRVQASNTVNDLQLWRYEQSYHGIPVYSAGMVVTGKEGRAVKSIGKYFPVMNAPTLPVLEMDDVLRIVQNKYGPDCHFPEMLRLVILPGEVISTDMKDRLCYRVPMVSQNTLQQEIFFIDAVTGEICYALPGTCQSSDPGLASTLYSGTQTIETDFVGGQYRLFDNNQSIHTRTMNHTTNLNYATELTDNNNIWNEQVKTLRYLQLSQVNPGWQDPGQTKPNLYLRIRDKEGDDIARTVTVKDSFPAFQIPCQILLTNPPYTVALFDDDGGPGDDFLGQFTLNVNPGLQTFSSFGNTGNYLIVQENNPALDAHWGIEETHDFFLNKLARNSYDNTGGQVRAYTQTGQGWPNAAWGNLDARMFLGDGDGINTTFRTYINVVAHEFTHGVIYHNGGGGLDYKREAGALNESIADIFGAALEFAVKPASANWLHGEEGSLIPGDYVRSMSDPHSKMHPDTYGANDPYWVDPLSPVDSGGIHTNSGVHNYWFYLLVEGGSGINANGENYNVTGIGMDAALPIVYHSLTTYLTATTVPDFVDAMQSSLMATEDLYGIGSEAYQAVMESWWAVGVGPKPEPQPWCSGNTLMTASMGSFGDGSGGNAYANQSDCIWTIQPEKANSIFLAFEAFDLHAGNDTLFIYDGQDIHSPLLASLTGDAMPDDIQSQDGVMTIHFRTGDTDTANGWQCNYTSDATPTCEGMVLLTASEGIIQDGSGVNDYANHGDCSWHIAPEGALSVTLLFDQFDTEEGKDVVSVYDGADEQSPLIGTWSGNTIPGNLTANSGEMFVTFKTDALGRRSGWSAVYSSIINSTNDPVGESYGIQIFPNPTSGKLYIQCTKEIPQAVTILNTTGVVMYADPGNDVHGSSVVDLDHFEDGMYILQVQFDSGLYMTRVCIAGK